MNQIPGFIREPSSWAGLATILQGVMLFFPTYTGAINVASMFAGAMAVTMRERSMSAPHVQPPSTVVVQAVQPAPGPSATTDRTPLDDSLRG